MLYNTRLSSGTKIINSQNGIKAVVEDTDDLGQLIIQYHDSDSLIKAVGNDDLFGEEETIPTHQKWMWDVL